MSCFHYTIKNSKIHHTYHKQSTQFRTIELNYAFYPPLNVLYSILYYVTPYCENSSTYFPSIQFFQLYIQTYINFNVFKVSHISRIDRETFRSNLHLHLHPRVFSTNCSRCNATGVGGKKSIESFATRFL